MTAITVSENVEYQAVAGVVCTEPCQKGKGWTVEQVLSGYGDFLAGRSVSPKLKNPDASFRGRTATSLCTCYLIVSRQANYDRFEFLLKERYESGEVLSEFEERMLDRFRDPLRISLEARPYLPEQLMDAYNPVSEETLIPASLAAEVLGRTIGAITNAATRGSIPGHLRRERRLWVPLGYIRDCLARRKKSS